MLKIRKNYEINIPPVNEDSNISYYEHYHNSGPGTKRFKPNNSLWIQVAIPKSLFIMHQSIYEKLSNDGLTFIDQAILNANWYKTLHQDDFFDQETKPSSVNFLFSNYPTGKTEEEAIKKIRKSQFNQAARDYKDEFVVFTATTTESQWSNFAKLCAEAGVTPYEQIEYFLRRGIGLVENYSEHKNNPISHQTPSF